MCAPVRRHVPAENGSRPRAASWCSPNHPGPQPSRCPRRRRGPRWPSSGGGHAAELLQVPGDRAARRTAGKHRGRRHGSALTGRRQRAAASAPVSLARNTRRRALHARRRRPSDAVIPGFAPSNDVRSPGRGHPRSASDIRKLAHHPSPGCGATGPRASRPNVAHRFTRNRSSPAHGTQDVESSAQPPLRSTRACSLAMRSFFPERTPSGAWWNRFRGLSGGGVAASCLTPGRSPAGVAALGATESPRVIRVAERARGRAALAVWLFIVRCQVRAPSTEFARPRVLVLRRRRRAAKPHGPRSAAGVGWGRADWRSR